LFVLTLGVGFCGIVAHRLVEPFFTFVPVDLERTLGVSLRLTIDKFQPDGMVFRPYHWAIAKPFVDLDSFGDVDHSVHAAASKLGIPSRIANQ
jgi:hypothetical protein